jgi:DNA-binding NarL/FixJ family response regulator
MNELDVPTASARLAQSLELSLATGQRLGIARGLQAFAALAIICGDDAVSARLEGAAAVVLDAIGSARSAAAQARLDGLLVSARQRLGPERTAELVAEGRLLGMHDAVRYALRFAATSAAHRAPGQPAGLGAAPDPGRADQNASQDGVLTPREHEIALLIARGLSNRGIAEELFISPATAARHVANILAKLGLNSRAQVAAWVVSQRLH